MDRVESVLRAAQMERSSMNVTPTLSEWSLGYAYDSTIEELRKLTIDELALFDSSVQLLRRYSRRLAYELVQLAQAQYLRIQSDSIAMWASDRKTQALLPDTVSNATAALVGWVLHFRLFLDHARRDLLHRFGEDSPECQNFITATRQAFDEHVGYRLAEKLRNYVAHCGMPPIVANAERKLGPTGKKETSLALLLDRDTLLSDYKKWGPVKADLQSMTHRFPVDPLIEDAAAGLQSVAETVIAADAPASRWPSRSFATSSTRLGLGGLRASCGLSGALTRQQ